MKFEGLFGAWLRQRREALDLTRDEFADLAACSAQTIRKLEANERCPSKALAHHLAGVLSIPEDDLEAFIAFARGVRSAVEPSRLLSPALRHNLPLQPTRFIGRTSEQIEIATRLADPACRLLTLLGPGGIGKTRLALQAVADRVEQYGDGVYFVALAPISSPGLIPAAIVSALQITLYGAEDPAFHIGSYLYDKEMLLILDNFEHLLEEVRFLSNLLIAAPRIKVLVTSRERLNIQEEWVLPVDGLSFPTDTGFDAAADYDAVQLFVQRACQVRPGFSFSVDKDAVIEICRMVEGMPLGLELAATWLRTLPCSQIATLIKRDMGFLATPLRNVPERHRSLRAVFDHSWSLLSEREHCALARLSVFRGGFDLEAAENVAGASLPVLAALVDKSLVRLNPSGRYDLHELLRQYAFQKLAEQDETDISVRRHATHFLHLARKAAPMLYGGDQVTWLDRLEAEHDNLRAVLAWSLASGEVEIGLDLAATVAWFWFMRGYWQEAPQWLHRLLENGPKISDAIRARGLYRIAWFLVRDDPNVAVIHARQAYELCQRLNDKFGVGFSLLTRGIVAMYQHDYVGVAALLEEAQQAYQETGLDWAITNALHTRGQLEAALGHIEHAVALYSTALYRSRQIDNFDTISWCLYMLGNLALMQGMEPRAQAYYEEGLRIAQQVHNTWLIAESLHGLGRVARIEKQYPEAKSLLEQALAMVRDLHSKARGAQVLLSLGQLACDVGDLNPAFAFLKEGLVLADESGERTCATQCIAGLARADSLRGKSSVRMVRLLAAAKQLSDSAGDLAIWDAADRTEFQHMLASLQAQFDTASFDADWAEGQAFTLEQATAYALET